MVSNLQLFNNDGLELLINVQTGESFSTVSGYARMTGKSRSVIAERLSKSEVITAEIETGGGVQLGRCVKITTVLEWLAKDNPSLVSVVIQKVKDLTGEQLELPVFPAKRQAKYKGLEKQAQKRLAKKINGKTEVQCKTGVIDILTGTEIIEVKKAKEWKHAIGQVLIYQLEYPDRQARIHLYDECSDEFKQMVIVFSSQLNVIATFEN